MATKFAYYNDSNPYCCEWARNLIKAGLVPDGDVDERSITAIRPDDLRGYAQIHLFCGLLGWPLALRLAGWPDDRPILTGSAPCQPFSVAGKGLGHDDPRHLWPHMHRIVSGLRPPVVMGEQVAGSAGYKWLDGVLADLEAQGYTGRAVDIPAGSVNAPHIRNRLYWVAHPDREHDDRSGQSGQSGRSESSDSVRRDVRLDDAASAGWLGDAQPPQRGPHAEGRSDVHDRADAGRPQASGGSQLAGQLPDWMEDAHGPVAECDARQPPGEDGLPDRSHTRPGFWDEWTLVGPDPKGKYRRVGLQRLANPAGGGGESGRPQCDERQLQDGDSERHEGDGGGHQGLGEPECQFCGMAHERLPGGDGLRPIDLLSKGQVQRVNKLRCLGNGLVIELAAEVIRAYMETHP